MRYFITLNDQEYQLELSRGADASVISTPADGAREAEPLSVEILTQAPDGTRVVKVGARIFRLALDASGRTKPASSELALRIDGVPVRARVQSELERQSTRLRAGGAGAKAAQVRAPLPGRIVKLSVKVGDRVLLGAPLLTIEAMKMENEIAAPRGGRITRVLVEPGATVDADAELLSIEEE
jgi:biotin carboxyl carrier protein